ncbi:MAG: trypsin-like peptidase domain-containing protein [Angelakisella sp.]|jgi:V8-like Glu-specific endopeptidase|nr:trypsin-like peptidase domain-containing protein [Angelakisella sp.]
MKKKISICLAVCLCLLTFTATTGFAFDMQEDSADVNSSVFQPGSGGVLCKDKNGIESFIPPKEFLPNTTPNSAAPYLPDTPDAKYVEFAPFSRYRPVVMIEAYFKEQEKPAIGSGAFIGPTGILTCAHVLYNRTKNVWAEKVYVYSEYMSETNYKKKYEVKNMYIGAEYVDTDLDDWGILTVTERAPGYYGFESTTNNSDLIGMNVMCVGYAPAEGSLSLLESKGVITKHPVSRALSGLFIEGEARKGMSGGPVLDDMFIQGIMIRAGQLNYNDYIKEDAIAMLIINPWLWDTIYDYSGR